MANNRVYELMYIADPALEDSVIGEINSEVEKIIAAEGGTVVKTEDMGRRRLAYKIKRFTEGYYFLFEIEGSGKEIAEIERRLRVSDKIVRYITVRVDEERKAADKMEAKKAARKARVKAAGGEDSESGEEEE
ncbi:MAG: 30S ribosomal protein S6 [Pyrinomonadaceae bacterium]